MANPLAKLFIELGIDTSPLDKGMAGLNKKFTAGATLAGAAVGDFVAQGITDYTRFDDQMRQVFSIMPGISAEARDKLTQDVRDISKEYGALTDEVIPALGTAIGSGIEQEGVVEFMRTAVKTAKAGASDAESSVKVLSAALNAYQMDVSETANISNDMFNAIDKGVISMEELAAGMANVMPNAAAMGLTFKETLAPITAMTLQGTPTANAITQVNAALVALQRTTPQMNQILKELGFETGQAAIDALGFQGALEAIRAEADRLGMPLIKVTGRMEGASAILQLTGQNAAKANDILDSFADTSGKVDAAFEEMEGGIGGAGRRLAAFFNDLKLTVGKELQTFGPLFYAFGPQLGRWVGRGFGAAFGFVAAQVPRLMAPVIARIGAAFAASQLGQSVATAVTNGLSSGPIMGRLGAIGGKWGKVLGVGAAAAMGAIIIAELAELGKTVERIGQAQASVNEQIAGIGKGDRGSLEEMRAELENIQRTRKELLAGGQGPVKDVLFSIFGVGKSELDRAEAELVEGIRRAHQRAAQEARYGASDVASAVEQAYDPLSSIRPPDVPAPEADVAGTKKSFAEMRNAILSGFGSIKEALKNPPQIISRADRIENMEGRLKKVMKNLHRAVQADDPINTSYWTKAAAKQAAQIDKMRGKSTQTTGQIKRRFEAMGIDIDNAWQETSKAAASESAKAKTSAVGAARQTVRAIEAMDLTSAGTNLMSTWASGIRAGIPSAVAAATDAAAAVAAVTSGQSPPPKGPLSKIDKGGENIVTAWADGLRRGIGKVRGAALDAAGAFAPSPGMGLAGAGGRGGDVHWHVGMLIADDHGIDELERRMGRRRDMRDRKRRRDFETPTGRIGQNGRG